MPFSENWTPQKNHIRGDVRKVKTQRWAFEAFWRHPSGEMAHFFFLISPSRRKAAFFAL